MIIDQTIKLGQCPRPFLMSFREMLIDWERLENAVWLTLSKLSLNKRLNYCK